MDERTLHLSQSVAKSFTGALAGILAARGIIDVTAQVTDYLPELESTAYRGATVQHLLDMTSGVRFSEDYTDPLLRHGPIGRGGGMEADPAPMPSPASTGRKASSSSSSASAMPSASTAAGSPIARSRPTCSPSSSSAQPASGLAQLLSEELWQKLGMEESANMTVDAAGFALADGGLNACLRDYGRFGQMILDNGAGIVPASWIEATRSGDHALFGGSYTAVLPRRRLSQPVLDRGPREAATSWRAASSASSSTSTSTGRWSW